MAVAAVGVLLLAAGCSSEDSAAVDSLPLPTGMAVDENGADDDCEGFEDNSDAAGFSDTHSQNEGGVAHVFVGRMYFPVTAGVVPLGVSVRAYAEPLSVDPSSYEGESSGEDGDFKLELRNGDDNVLEQSFRADRPVFFREGRPVMGRFPRPGSVGDGGVFPVLEPTVFIVRVAEPPVYDSFAVSWAGRELFAAERPASAPRAEVLGVSEGQVFNAWDGIDLCLNGGNEDGDRLSFRVYYSTDSGDTYRLYTDNSLYPYAEWQDIYFPRVRVRLGSFNSRRLNDGRGGFSGRVGVSVSDGASTVFVESPTFSVLPRGEQPNIFRIRGVGYNVAFTGDEMISLEARGGSGLGDDTRYSWRSSLDGDLGSGKAIELPAGELTLGEHTVTVVATDETSGLSYNHSGTFSVIPAGTPFMASDDMVHLRPHEYVYIRVRSNDAITRDASTGFSSGYYSLNVTVPGELGTTKASRFGNNDFPAPVVGYIGRVSGYDSFQYEICDRDSFCDTAVVRVGVGVADCTILGNDGDDHLIGTPDDDIICGLGGDDIIEGMGGDDIIRAGAGDDTIFGGAGNDYIQGETGDDTIRGDTGDDLILGGEGSDTLYGGPGYDTLGGGNSIIRQDPGDQLYHASAPTPATYEELTSEEVRLIDTAVRTCEDSTPSYTYQQNICAQTTASLCQTTTTANSRNPNPNSRLQRTVIASFVCETSELTRTIAYEHKCPQAHSARSCNYQSIDFRDALKRDAQTLYTPLVEDPRQITEETLNKLRQLAEAIHEFAITIYRDQQPAYL